MEMDNEVFERFAWPNRMINHGPCNAGFLIEQPFGIVIGGAIPLSNDNHSDYLNLFSSKRDNILRSGEGFILW